MQARCLLVFPSTITGVQTAMNPRSPIITALSHTYKLATCVCQEPFHNEKTGMFRQKGKGMKQQDNFFAPMNITLDCTECGQRKTIPISILDLGQYMPVNERGKLVYKGKCKACQGKRSA